MVRIVQPLPHSEAASDRFARSTGFFTESKSDGAKPRRPENELIGNLCAHGWVEESNRTFSHPEMNEFQITLENGMARVFQDGVFLSEYDTISAAHTACQRSQR